MASHHKGSAAIAQIALSFFLLCNCALGAGVTIVTQGQAFGDTPNLPAWVSSMADDIISEQIVGTATKYRITVTSPDWRTLEARSSAYGGTSPVSSSSGEIVIELDWSAIADAITFEASTADIAVLVRKCLTNANFFPRLGHPVVELPIHLIGHSRGGVLVCHLADLLGQRGIWVNQLTMLDPHPADTGLDTLLHLPMIHENVIFADNYMQLLRWPNGIPVLGSYLRTWWIQGVHLRGGYTLPNLFAEHADVHLWYHGSINLETPMSDGSGGTITSTMRNDTGWWLTEEKSGAKTGHFFSRLQGGTYKAGNRPGSYVPAGSPFRVPWSLDVSGAAVWDNIEITGFETDRSAAQGASFSIVCPFYDANRDATITIGLDSDQNPYNGVVGSALLTKATATITGNELSEAVGTSKASLGTYYVYAKISNGTHTRYYYSKAQLTVNPPGPTPRSISLSVDPPSSPVGPGNAVTISGQALYNTGVPVPVGTVSISIDGQEWTASISQGSYSRVITAPNTPRTYTVYVNAWDGQNRTGNNNSRTLTVEDNPNTPGFTVVWIKNCGDVYQKRTGEVVIYDERDYFAPGDSDGFGLWSVLRIHPFDTSEYYRARTLIYQPDGDLAWSIMHNDWEAPDEGEDCYWWCGWDEVPLLDQDGEWTFRWDVQKTGPTKWYNRVATRKMVYRFNFTEHKMAKGIDSSLRPQNPGNVFYQTDARHILG